MNEIKYNYGSKGVDDDRTILIGKDWIPLKYYNVHVKNVLDFAPTKTYHRIKEEKYQRYEPNDDYHECNINFDSDEICDKGCSKYRNIDKIRIIYNYIDQLLKIKYLTQEGVLNYTYTYSVPYIRECDNVGRVLYCISIFDWLNKHFLINLVNKRMEVGTIESLLMDKGRYSYPSYMEFDTSVRNNYTARL